MALSLGIDTGGTYTDAVLYDPALGVIAAAKALTTRHDLAEGGLIEVLKPYAVEGQPISVVYPPTRHVPGKLRVMIDFLVEITRLPADAAAPRSRK